MWGEARGCMLASMMASGILPAHARLTTAFLVLAAVGCAGAPGAQKSQEPPPVEASAYYPLAPGWKWAYAVERGGDMVLATYTVVDRAGTTVAVQAGEDRLHYNLQADGIVRMDTFGAGGGDYLLKTPIRAGATWPVASGTARVVAVGETVEVDAGRFTNCATIEERRRNPDRMSRTTYAPGVGPIKIELQAAGGVVPDGVESVRATLRGFTRPGQDPLASAAGLRAGGTRL